MAQCVGVTDGTGAGQPNPALRPVLGRPRQYTPPPHHLPAARWLKCLPNTHLQIYSIRHFNLKLITKCDKIRIILHHNML